MSLFTTWTRTRLAMPTLRTRGVSPARAEIEFELIAMDLEEGWAREEHLDECGYQEVLDDIAFYDSVSDEELEELEMAHFRHKYGLEDWDDSDPNALPVE